MQAVTGNAVPEPFRKMWSEPKLEMKNRVDATTSRVSHSFKEGENMPVIKSDIESLNASIIRVEQARALCIAPFETKTPFSHLSVRLNKYWCCTRICLRRWVRLFHL